MSNTLEYILTLKDNISGKMQKIGVANDKQLEIWANVEKQVRASETVMKSCGVSNKMHSIWIICRYFCREDRK